MYQLRPNQIEPVKRGIEFFKSKDSKPSIIVAPTAFGKSVVVAKIAEGVEGNVLVLQPSKELLEQNYAKYTALGLPASIYSASLKSKEISKVTFATIGSIKNIGNAFKLLGFNKMIIDEAHLFPRSVDSMLGKFLLDSSITHVLGLTATPLKLQAGGFRGDHYTKLVMLTSKSKMGNFFKEIIYVAQVSEMVNLGFWSKLKYEISDFNDSKLRFNSTGAEYTDESIKVAYTENLVAKKIIDKIGSIPERKSILVFVPSISEAMDLAKVTPNAGVVYGNMPPKERSEMIDNFKRGKVRVIFNVNVLSVGFDHPKVDCIICARSTASISWYYQALGRGTRIHPEKTDCLIVDYTGNVEKFGKIEDLEFVKEALTWKLYGRDGVLLSGIRMDHIGTATKETEREKVMVAPKILTNSFLMPFGKYKGVDIKDIPESYRDWMYKNFTWDVRSNPLKKELEKLQK